MVSYISKNPFIGKPLDETGLIEVNCIMLEKRFEIQPNEVLSMFLSNPDFFGKPLTSVALELSR